VEDVVNDDTGHAHDEHTPKSVEYCDFESPIFADRITCSVEYTVYDETDK